MEDVESISLTAPASEGDQDAMAYLTGAGVRRPHPPGIAPEDGGGKFTPQGHVQPYPGNTFLCHLDRTSDAYAALGAMQDAVRALPQADHFTFLPKPSFHMTVFCGVSGNPIGSDGWPQSVARDTDLDAIHALFLERLDGVRGPTVFHVAALRLFGGFSLLVEPAEPASDSALVTLRSRLQAMTGLYRSDFYAYRFHMSLGYLTRWMRHSDARAYLDAIADIEAAYLPRLATIQLGPVEFCTFENMHHFTVHRHIDPDERGR